MEFIRRNRASVTRAMPFCWGIADNGTWYNDDQGCGPEVLGPIRALGVELLPAGHVSRNALLNGTWRQGLEPLAEYAVAHNWTGVHVDFEEVGDPQASYIF